MNIHFQIDHVTFFPEDRVYFEKRIVSLFKFLGVSEDDDSVEVFISLSKSKSHSGERFESSVCFVVPEKNTFLAKVSAENIKKCADLLKDKLKAQIVKFHDSHK